AVTRVAKGQPRRDQNVEIAAHDPPDKTERALGPLWGATPSAGSGGGSDDQLAAGSGAGSAAVGSGSETSFFGTRESKLGVGFATGSVIAIVIGLALWSSESSLQSQINTAPTNTAADIAALRDKEDRASRYAWSGNILVGLGLVAGGVGAYYLWTDHKNRG